MRRRKINFVGLRETAAIIYIVTRDTESYDELTVEEFLDKIENRFIDVTPYRKKVSWDSIKLGKQFILYR